MKVGNIVYCKKSLFQLFSKDECYIVKDLSNSGVRIYFKLDDWTTFTFGKEHFGWARFDDYFYTEKELRKLKLDKINGKIEQTI